MNVGCHAEQEDKVTQDEAWVCEPPEVVGQVLCEVAGLHVAIGRGESKGTDSRREGHWVAVGEQRKEEDPTNE